MIHLALEWEAAFSPGGERLSSLQRAVWGKGGGGYQMTDKNQEHLAAYLELERFLTALQADQPIQLPEPVTPEQLRLYQMALLFHAATPENSEPRQAFTAQLYLQLEKALHPLSPEPQPAPLVQPLRAHQHLPRRLLVAGGTTVVAALVGAGSDWLLEPRNPRNPSPRASSPTAWVVVTTVAELGNGAIRFTEAALIGYVVRNPGGEGDPANSQSILAFSAACPHKGCLVQWSGADRTFRCPCHEAVFSQEGQPLSQTSPWRPLHPLARLDVRIEQDGHIAVRMPAE